MERKDRRLRRGVKVGGSSVCEFVWTQTQLEEREDRREV